MAEQIDPRMAASAADLATRYGADAVVFARKLAWEHKDPEVSAYWGGVLVLLVTGEQQLDALERGNSDTP